MSSFLEEPDGNAVVYCEGAYHTPNGKTAHGLVRFTKRYRVTAVIDSTAAGEDAGEYLSEGPFGLPVVPDLTEALAIARDRELEATHFVVGLAPDGGRLSDKARLDVMDALGRGLNVDSGLHDYLGDDPELAALARARGGRIRDVRKPPPIRDLHFFSGKIERVDSLRIAILGTDSAIGKRTTTAVLTNALARSGCPSVMIGTGQTAWMQGVRYGIVLDSLVNDFVSGEIEHAVWSAWKDDRPDVILIEGQGSLLNPAYPGGFEILAAARPHGIVLQHAPARKEYDGFPGFPIQPLTTQIQAVELVSGKPVVAVAVNHENIDTSDLDRVCREVSEETGLPAVDVLVDGPDALVAALLGLRERTKSR
jgi:uncharacterized NAD-dependent epimerase/dehydratase family protein